MNDEENDLANAKNFYTSTIKKRRKGQRMTLEERIEAQATFLAAYEKTANVLTAAEQTGIDRTLVYYWLEHSEQFLLAYGIADKAANSNIEAEIHRRAIEGWEEPLVSAGKRLGTVRKYSDVLLMFYAKKRIPEYRDKSQVDLNATVQGNLTHGLNIDTRGMSSEGLREMKEWAAREKARQEERKQGNG